MSSSRRRRAGAGAQTRSPPKKNQGSPAGARSVQEISKLSPQYKPGLVLKRISALPMGVEDNGDLEHDFTDFGIGKAKIKTMIDSKEPEVDTLAQLVHGSYGEKKREQELKLDAFLRKQERRRMWRSKNSPNAKKPGAHVQIYLTTENNHWVLFDPLLGFPPTLPCDPPNVFIRYSRYVPGNPKIVAYNTESWAVALRKVPECFKDMEVEYEKTGPKLVKAKK